MAWFKRNLFFVLSMAAGLGLTIYCAFLFAGDLSANADVKKDADEAQGQYDLLQKKSPYPNEENIQRAKDDQSHARQFVDDVRKSFAPPPALPVEDEKGFSAYLEDTIADLKTKATNAAVLLPDNFAFAFTDRRNKLNHPLEAIQPWMQQLSQIKEICDVLYQSKINSVASLRRVAVSTNDLFFTPNDTFPARILDTQLQTVTPYKIDFRCFTRELADVMKGLARSSNCFIIKNIVVKPAGMKTAEASQAPAAPVLPPSISIPVPQRQRGESQAEFDREVDAYHIKVQRATAAAAAAAERAAANASGTVLGAPRTVLREQLLYITLSVDAIKFKGADH